MLRTTGDLVALCGVTRSDPNAIAAIHFCEGYLVGLDHFSEVTGRPFRGTLYCPPPNVDLTRDQVVAMLRHLAPQESRPGGRSAVRRGRAVGRRDLAVQEVTDQRSIDMKRPGADARAAERAGRYPDEE